MAASRISVAGTNPIGRRNWMSGDVRSSIRSAWQPLLVWLVWIAMTCNAVRFVVQYGSRNLFLDDLWLVLPRFQSHGLTWALLWAQHNEHRNPLPQILQYALYRTTGDVRSGIWLDVFILSAIAVVMIALARRLRGRITWTDAFFPVLWLNTGNAESLLMGYQISMMLPTALVSLMMILIATAPDGLRPRAVITCALALVCLPMCGGPGFLQAPALAVWAFATGFVLRKRVDDASRRSGTILMAAAVITVAMLGAYLVGLRSPPGIERRYTISAIGEVTLDVLGLSLGPAAETWMPWAGIGVLLFALSGLALVVRAWFTTPVERLRTFGIACCLGANAMLALGIGVGRSGIGSSFPIRYVMLTAPIVCTAYVSWSLYGPRVVNLLVRSTVCVTWIAAFLIVGYPMGERLGTARKNKMDALERDIGLELPAFEIIRRYNSALDGDPNRLFYMYSNMAKQRIEPFDRASEAEIRSFGHEQAGMSPSSVEGLVTLASRPGTTEPKGLNMAHGALIFFDVPDTATKMRLDFAFPTTEELARHGSRARFCVTMSYANFKDRRVLLMSTFDPTSAGENRPDGAVDLDLPAQTDRKIVMQFMMPHDPGAELLYGRIADVRFE